MKKRLSLGAFAIAMALTLTACGSGGNGGEKGGGDAPTATGGTATIALPAQPATLDTHVAAARVSSSIGRDIFESLVTLGSDFSVQPMLAESYEESEDGKSITFKLREGVKFHDGSDFDAEDVVASMERWMRLSGPGQGTFEGATISATGDHEVVLELAAPTATALPVLAHAGEYLAAILPSEVIAEASDEGFTNEQYIGTGPFQFTEWVPDQSITLTKYADYAARSEPADGLAGDRTALLDELKIAFVPDPATRMLGLESGEYDLADEIPFDNADRVMGNPDLKPEVTADGLLMLYYNKKEGIFSDVEARTAVDRGLDKSAIMSGAVGNEEFYDFVNHMMMKQQEGLWNTDVGADFFMNFDVEASKKALADAGYAGAHVRIITSRDYSEMYNGAVVVEQLLRELGLEPELIVSDWATFSENRDDPTGWELMVLSNTPKIEPSSLAFMRKDFAGWTDSPELDALLAEYRGSKTLDDARGLYDELQEWVYDYVPVTKFGDVKYLGATTSKVSQDTPIFGGIHWRVSKEA